ncbi:MAG: hypothetical protein ACRENG_30355, partial [bacterium]
DHVIKLVQQEGISLNQFFITAISNEIIRQGTHAFIKGKAASFKESDFAEALAEIPNIIPEEIDKL